MAKKEFKVGEVFQCGLVKLKCVKENHGCRGCLLDEECDCYGQLRTIVGECSGITREDKTNVIFIKVED